MFFKWIILEIKIPGILSFYRLILALNRKETARVNISASINFSVTNLTIITHRAEED